jgi:hypothetical protein
LKRHLRWPRLIANMPLAKVLLTLAVLALGPLAAPQGPKVSKIAVAGVFAHVNDTLENILKNIHE